MGLILHPGYGNQVVGSGSYLTSPLPVGPTDALFGVIENAYLRVMCSGLAMSNNESNG